MNLYPLTFQTIFKDKIWGGNKINTVLGKDFSPLPNCGETWEISGVKGNESIVKNGRLKGCSLPEIISEYKEDLIGRKTYQKFGDEFPLLIKFIDANDDLSIQVHPDDKLAKKRHNSFGKTEMWYIIEAEEGAKLNSGFNKKVNKETYLEHLNNNKLDEILNYEEVQSGNVFFLPAGRIHYIGKGICLAEIQQTSDITYRIFDFNRKDDKGNLRELHTELALEAIDFNYHTEYKTSYQSEPNIPVELVKSNYFTTNILTCSSRVRRNYLHIDSFVIYICVEGEGSIIYPSGEMGFRKGDSILIPAVIKDILIDAAPDTKILEVYV